MSAASSSLPSLSLPTRAAAAAAAVPSAVRRGAWRIEVGEAMTLKATEASVLRVRQGRIWVTCDATATWGSEDLVLAPGESLRVAAGQRLVLEPWDGYGATCSWDAATPGAAS